MHHPSDRNMILQLHLLSFSTGQPHPFAEQPIIFIAAKAPPLGICNAVVEIVGDFLVLLIVFLEEWNENEDMFFVVLWKKGEVHCVSISGLPYIPSSFAYTSCSALFPRMENSLRFYFLFARHPHDPQPESKYGRSNEDCDR